MFTTRVKPNDIEKLRIEAEYYQPEKMRNIAKLKKVCKKFVTLSELCEFITDGTHQTPTYVEHGVKFLSSKNIGVCEIDFDDTKFVTKDAFDELKRTKCAPIPGDILISKNGKIGTAGVYRDTHPSVGLFVSVALLRYCSDIDSDFLAMYLNSNGGWWQFSRSSKTGVITNLHLEEIREVEVPVLDHSVQKYIGDKVRQAERLRAGGKLVHSRVLDSFESLLGHYDKQNKSFERVSPDLLADRLDQNHYKTSLLSCLKLLQLKKHVSLADKKYFAGLTDGDHGNPKYGEGPIYLRASEMTGGLISIDSAARIDPEYAKGVSLSCWAKADDIIFSVVGTLGLTAIVDSRTAGLMSRGVAKIASNILPNYYVKAFFKTHYFQAQLERHSVGSVQRGVYLSALEQIIVPILEQSIIEEIAEREMLADDMVKAATVLTNTAKHLVEALIEGQLTEAELIAAEQALQAGNDYFDRRILTRLKTDGIDGQGPALFGDLDELYHLLTQAAED